jgi:hypothetical protein
MLCGVIACVGCVLTECRLRLVRRMCVDCVQVAVEPQPARSQHTVTPNSNCAEPPEDGHVTPETCRGIDS